MPPTKKILIVDNHPLFRKGNRSLLKNEWPNLEIFEATSGLEALDLYQNHKPGVILIDYRIPHMNGFDASEKLLIENKRLKIILVTMYDTMAIALKFFKIGGHGFVSKGCDVDEIINAIRTVSNGGY